MTALVSLLCAAGVAVAYEALFDASCRLPDIVHIVALHEGIERIADIEHCVMRCRIRAVKLVRDSAFLIGFHPLRDIAKADVKQSVCGQLRHWCPHVLNPYHCSSSLLSNPVDASCRLLRTRRQRPSALVVHEFKFCWCLHREIVRIGPRSTRLT